MSPDPQSPDAGEGGNGSGPGSGAPAPGGLPSPHDLTDAEAQSVTTEDFRVPDELAPHYGDALRALNEADVLYAVGGLYALHAYTGLHRETKDLDLLLPADEVLHAAEVLADTGFRLSLHNRHWLAKAARDGASLDLVYGLANGLYLVDPGSLERAPWGWFLGEPVRIDPPEDLILHRLFILERHRNDLSDIAHLLLHRGRQLDWEWLVERVGQNWRLLTAQVLLFDFIYPDCHDCIPSDVREDLLKCALVEATRDRSAEPEKVESPAEGELPTAATRRDGAVCQGPLISRFSFAVDVNEWGFRDYRKESVQATRELPRILEIAGSDVWDAVEEER